MGLALAGLFLTGCTSTKQFLPKVTDERPTSDKALIIVERSSEMSGGALCNNVYDNKTPVGKLGPSGRLVWLRDPGPMELLINGEGAYAGCKLMYDHWWQAAQGGQAGRTITVEAGKRYDYKLNAIDEMGNIDIVVADAGLPYGFILGGLGIPLKTKEQSERGDALVILRLLSDSFNNDVLGLHKIGLDMVDVKTGKAWGLFPTPSKPWRMFYLPVGEYNFTEYYEMSSDFQRIVSTTYKVNAEFSVTKTKSAIYIGDLYISKGKPRIGKDSDAARVFLKENSKELPYSETELKFNE